LINGRPLEFDKGLEAEKTGDIAGAARQFALAQKKNPRWLSAFVVPAEREMFADPLAVATRSLRWPWSGYYLANAELSLGDVKSSVENFYAFLKLEPSVVEARVNLGAALQNLGRLDDAIEQYTLGLKEKPAFSEVYNNLGVAYQDNGKPDGAIKAFKVTPTPTAHCSTVNPNPIFQGSAAAPTRRFSRSALQSRQVTLFSCSQRTPS